MLDGWKEFYLFVGGAAAVLIGLIFVVIGLMQDRPRSTVLVGSKIYMGPIVLGLSFILVLSAAALAPRMEARPFAAITAIVALWGLARGVRSILGIRRFGKGVHWTDLWFYGVIPSVIYLAFAVVAAGIWKGWDWALRGLAGVIIAGLLCAVRNEWDLITWITPQSDDKDEFAKLPDGNQR